MTRSRRRLQLQQPEQLSSPLPKMASSAIINIQSYLFENCPRQTLLKQRYTGGPDTVGSSRFPNHVV